MTRCFEELEGGSENAMKDYKKVYEDRIDKLIRQVQQDLDKNLRVKIITLITVDVHLRDVVESFIAKKITEGKTVVCCCGLCCLAAAASGCLVL